MLHILLDAASSTQVQKYTHIFLAHSICIKLIVYRVLGFTRLNLATYEYTFAVCSHTIYINTSALIVPEDRVLRPQC